MTVSSAAIPCATKKDRILIIGATGFMGQFVTKASLAFGRPTFLLVRPDQSVTPSKDAIVKNFQDKGAKVIHVSQTHLIHLFFV